MKDMPISCDMCEWKGVEDELVLYKTDILTISSEAIYFKGCPNCKTNDYLMDLEDIQEEMINILSNKGYEIEEISLFMTDYYQALESFKTNELNFREIFINND